MQTHVLFQFNHQRLALMISDAVLIALAVLLSYSVAFTGRINLVVGIEGFYAILLYWLGTLLIFAYGKLYTKPSTEFTRKDLKWLAMMNVYVVGAVFITQYAVDPEYWLFALLFMLASFIIRTILSAVCIVEGQKADIIISAIIPLALGAIAALLLTPSVKPYAPLPDTGVEMPFTATLLYFLYSTSLLALGRFGQAWIIKKARKRKVEAGAL